MRASSHAALRWVAVAVSIAAILGSQAAAEAVAPRPVEGQTAAVGRAGFAYVATLRRFAAAVLWNRLESQFHEFYAGVELQDMTFLLPNTAVIVALDPQLTEPYLVAPFILFKRGDREAAYELAEQGVRDNPRSGMLRASYAQMLQLDGKTDEALVQARAAEGSDWMDPLEQWQGYVTVREVYTAADLPDEADRIRAEMASLEEIIDRDRPVSERQHDHDHDGDGRPDH